MLHQGGFLGRYEVGGLIGRGGFGLVYKGTHSELGIDVAIKEYFPSELSVREDSGIRPSKPEFAIPFAEGLERFLKEAKQLEKFSECPAIVTCRDFFHANGTAYMIMDYVDGLSLSSLLERRESDGNPFTEQDLVNIIKPLLTGLQIVHESGVYHRDIKPSNILVKREDGVPVLIDFGAAKQMTSRHTKSLAPYTDGYAAMEQVGEGEIGPWTDIYGVGAIMWRMVAGGMPPFMPPNPVTVQRRAFDLMQGRGDPLPSVQNVGQGRFSDTILQSIDECLKIKLEERIQTCTELIKRLSPPSSDTVDISYQTAISRSKKPSERKVIGLKNTETMSNNLKYVGFWPRLGASLIDSLIWIAIVGPILTIYYGEAYWIKEGFIAGPLDFLLSYVSPAVATIWFWVAKHATPGKMAVRAKIVDARSGMAPRTGQYVGRYFAYILSTIPLGLGFIWVAIDEKKRGWHDMMAGTVVVSPKEVEQKEVIFDGS